MNSILVIVVWFGPWPEWTNLFLESCAWNGAVNWLMVTDQPPPENQPPNVRFLRLSPGDLAEAIASATGVAFRPQDPYKFCDAKPMLGHALADRLSGYDWFGYGDLDVIYGRIRDIYTDDLLARYEVISSLRDRLSGHLALFRNTETTRLAYRRTRRWREVLTDDRHRGFDEGSFSRVFYARTPLHRPFVLGRSHFRDLGADPWDNPQDRWIWSGERLFRETAPQRAIPYFHFMLWKSDRYRPKAWGPAPWPRLDRPLVNVDWREARAGFAISPRGFDPLAPPV